MANCVLNFTSTFKNRKKNLVIKPLSIKSSIQQNANIKIVKLGVGGVLSDPAQHPLAAAPHVPLTPPLTPGQAAIYIVSLWICLFWTFYINEIIQYVEKIK